LLNQLYWQADVQKQQHRFHKQFFSECHTYTDRQVWLLFLALNMNIQTKQEEEARKIFFSSWIAFFTQGK